MFSEWAAEGTGRVLVGTGSQTVACGPRAGRVRMCYGLRPVVGCNDGSRVEVVGWGAPLALGLAEGKPVGPVARLKAVVVHRPECGWNFLDASDASGDSAGACANALCRRDGTVNRRRAPLLAAALGGGQRASVAADAGGCLFVEVLDVLELWRGDDVGLALLHAVLRWLLEEGSAKEGRWTLAAVRPWRLPSVVESTFEDEAIRHVMDYGVEMTLDGAAREQRAEVQEEGDAAFRKVQVQFHRCGFRQARPCGDVWFLVPQALPKAMGLDALPTKGAADAALPRPSAPARVPEAHPEDVALVKLLKRGMRYPGPNALAATLVGVTGPGKADARRCLALHHAVRAGFSSRGCLAVLVDAGAPLDDADHEGRTALHVACTRLDVDQVDALVALGASSTALDIYQCTPLDLWRDAREDCVERAALRGLPDPLDEAFDDAEDLLA